MSWTSRIWDFEDRVPTLVLSTGQVTPGEEKESNLREVGEVQR